MKTTIEDWSDDILDLEDFQVERALARGFLDAIHRARVFNTNIVVSKDGQMCELPPSETHEMEARSLKFISETNEKIAKYLDEHPEEDHDCFHRKSLSQPLYAADPARYLRAR